MRDTFVIARNTAMTFKGKPTDAKAIGKGLGVRYILEGSVQPSGDRMRVNAQLIDTGSGAHLWAQQFDTPRADLMQTQDAIIAHLANTLDLQLQQAYAASAKRTPAANSDAEDLALQCSEGQWKAGFIGKEADAAYALCERALAIDPNNVRALMALGIKPFVQALVGISGDPKSGFERADELEFKAIALDPDWTWPHDMKGDILREQGRVEDAVAEHEPSARSTWTHPTWTPSPNWASTTDSSGDSTKALNIWTGRFWRARPIRRSSIGTTARRGPILG